MSLRSGCRATKTIPACEHYSYQLGRCKLGRVKYTCSLCKQPKPGTKAHRDAFYGGVS